MHVHVQTNGVHEDVAHGGSLTDAALDEGGGSAAAGAAAHDVTVGGHGDSHGNGGLV